jgi:hypothetical protein
MRLRPLRADKLLLAVGIALTLAAGLTALKQPAFGDSQAYVIPNGQKMAETAFYPFIDGEVHPPLYFLIEAVAFRIFGEHIEVAHTLILILALTSVWATYSLGSRLGGPAVGAAAALLLASWPPFLIQTRLIRLSIPLTAFSILTLLAAQRGWPLGYALFGSAAALTKAPGVFVPAVTALLVTMRLARFRIPKLVLWLPVAVHLVWLVACKLHYGWFLHPDNTADFRFSLVPLTRGWSFWAQRLLIDQRAWIPVLITLLAASKRAYYLLFPPILIACVFGEVQGLSISSGFAVGLLVSFALLTWNLGGLYRVLALLPLLITGLFASYYYQFPRYLLPAWPAVALVAARVMGARRFATVLIPLFALSFVVSAMEHSWGGWKHHESNLFYTEAITGRKEAAEFLERTAGEKPIIADKPADELLNPAFGYVSKPLHVLRAATLKDAECPSVKKAAYYFKFPSPEGKLERQIGALLKRCGITLKTEWGGVYQWKFSGGLEMYIFRIVHSDSSFVNNIPPGDKS